MHFFFFFEFQIKRRFFITNTIYKYTCDNTNCDFTCEMSHFMLIVKVKSLVDDQIDIVFQTDEKFIENILLQIFKPRYNYKI